MTTYLHSPSESPYFPPLWRLRASSSHMGQELQRQPQQGDPEQLQWLDHLAQALGYDQLACQRLVLAFAGQTTPTTTSGNTPTSGTPVAPPPVEPPPPVGSPRCAREGCLRLPALDRHDIDGHCCKLCRDAHCGRKGRWWNIYHGPGCTGGR